MSNIERTLEEYKPYKIESRGHVYLIKSMKGDFAIKMNPLISYDKLYRYLYSRGFTYLPELVADRGGEVVLKYEDDLSIDNYQKGEDLFHLVGLLHNKTSYFKEISLDRYKELYENIEGNIRYLKEYYDFLFDKFILEDMSPSKYVFLRNYSFIYGALEDASKRVLEWYELIKDDNKERVCLCHGNLRLEHYIKNNEEYLISFDNYSFDIPVLDLYNFYLEEWENVDMMVLLDEYNRTFELLDKEKKLWELLILIPKKIEFSSDELDNCMKVRSLINYLNKTFKLIGP